MWHAEHRSGTLSQWSGMQRHGGTAGPLSIIVNLRLMFS